jgi:hypothetical protein
MLRRTGLLLLVAVAFLTVPAAARASITVIGDLRPAGSVVVTLAAAPYPGQVLDKMVVESGGVHVGLSETAAVLEPAAFRNFGSSGWTDGGNDTSSYGSASGPAVAYGYALVFDLYFNSKLGEPLAFDFYAYGDTNSAPDFSSHVAYNGVYWTIVEPALSLQDVQSVPEPTTLIIWSLLGGLGISIGTWWRKAA